MPFYRSYFCGCTCRFSGSSCALMIPSGNPRLTWRVILLQIFKKCVPPGWGGTEGGKLIRRGQLHSSVARVAEDVGQVRQWVDRVRFARFDQ